MVAATAQLRFPAMSFFSDFAALGYSAIVLIVTFVFIGALIFGSMGMAKRPLWMRLAFIAVLIALFIPATTFLAGQNRMLNDAVRSDGGIQLIEQQKQVD